MATILNMLMRSELKKASRPPAGLTPELARIADSGLMPLQGCNILREFAEMKTNASPRDFPDKSGYEAFINSIHIDDYVSENLVGYACELILQVFLYWTKLPGRDVLRGIIAKSGDVAVVKIHTVRPGESLLSSDLEGFSEAILITESDQEFNPFKN